MASLLFFCLLIHASCWDVATCSLGLVLPPYNDYYIQADLSDVMLQLQCEYRGEMSPLNKDVTHTVDEILKSHLLFLLQICSLCCPAPLNHRDMCFWLQGDCDLLISLSLYVKQVLIHMCSLCREYCKRLQISDNNTQFLQNFLSLMLDLSPESDECELRVLTVVRCSLFVTLQTHQ